MKKRATVVICAMILVSATTTKNPSGEWTATNSKGGIKSYVGKSSNGNVIPTKVEMTVLASPEKVLKAITDMNGYTAWVPYCKKSYTIQCVSDTVFYAYQRISAPLVTDRDLAMRVNIHQIDKNNYNVLLTAVPSFVKKEKDAIRIEHFMASYRVSALTNKTTHVEQVCEVNIGGSVPSFLIRWANRNQPHETFENLRNQLLNNQ